jgi:hypothetical protein
MTGVFMLSLDTIGVRTRVMPRFFVIFTYHLADPTYFPLNVAL